MKPLNAIVAVVDKVNVIGVDGDLAIYNKKDMRWFTQITAGKIVIMGKNTMKSLKQPLRGRFNIVISRSLYKEVDQLKHKVGLLSKKKLVTIIDTKYVARARVDFEPMRVFKYRDFYVVKDMEDAVRYANIVADQKGIDEIFVIGGSETYNEFVPYINELYITIYSLPKLHMLFSYLKIPSIETAFFNHIDTRIKSPLKHFFLSLLSKSYKKHFNTGKVISRERHFSNNIQIDHLIIKSKYVKNIECIL